MRLTALLTFFLAGGMASQPCWAWGARGHELVTAVAVDRAPAALKNFFKANVERLRKLTLVPDSKWKQTQTYQAERFNHFYQWDIYGQSNVSPFMPGPLADILHSVDVSFVKENGTAVWRSDQVFGLLTKAIRDRKYPEILQWSGILSHYIGDLSQPMHVTVDFDGQSINRRGIHKLYEVDVIERADETYLYNQILRATSQVNLNHSAEIWRGGWSTSPVIVATHELATQSLEDLEDVIALFDDGQTAPDRTMLSFSVPEMARGAKLLAEIWSQAWVAAGAPTNLPRTAVTTADPDFVPFNFAGFD